MLTLKPFSWRRLTPSAELEHCLDESGALLLRVAGAPATPISLDAYQTSGIDALRASDGDGWMLHTREPPRLMLDVATRWMDLVHEASETFGVDERVLLATIAVEIGNVPPDGDNEVKAPHTRVGYPSRTGENDAGDGVRDTLDWTASFGARSSHGLMQTTLKQATQARPDLFAKVTPDRYRSVLADPMVSMVCGAEVLAQMALSVRADPLAQRVVYALGGGVLGPVATGPWGVRIDDGRRILGFVVAWNDEARLRAGERIDALALGSVTSLSGPTSLTAPAWPWILAVAAASAVAGGTAVWWIQRRPTACEAREADEEDDEDEEEEGDDAFVMLPATEAARLLSARTLTEAEDAPSASHGSFFLPE